jgi:FlaA1/EpsC-like NDP-sugar epimerase
MKRICIFGGSGFLGTALIEKLISMGELDIVTVARNEGGLVKLKERFPTVEIIVGDIADRWVVQKAMSCANDVYLLSAMKHVGLAETDVNTCAKTNIIGTMNVIEESIITVPDILMFISSDKAAQSTGVYGCTKKIGEKLMKEAEGINRYTKYRVIRYGNVWGSTGSISTKWKPKMLAGEEVIITDPEASRFFWEVGDAVDVIFKCIDVAINATPSIPIMKAVKMGVVLNACMEVWGQSPVKIIGLQPGENKVETTDGITFSDSVEQFTRSEFIDKFLKKRANESKRSTDH